MDTNNIHLCQYPVKIILAGSFKLFFNFGKNMVPVMAVD